MTPVDNLADIMSTDLLTLSQPVKTSVLALASDCVDDRMIHLHEAPGKGLTSPVVFVF